MRYEYCVSAGPGTLVDVGEVRDGSYDERTLHSRFDDGWWFARDAVEWCVKNRYDILIGPVGDEA